MAADPTGPEFRVNTTTAGDQNQGTVAALANGRFVVTWRDNGDIKAQIFSANGAKFGGEIVVTGLGGEQKAPVVAGLKDGRFVVAWENHNPGFFAGDGSGSSIWARVFTVDGTPDATVNGGAAMLVNNIGTEGDQFDPSISAHRDGGYVITWTSDYAGTGDLDVAGRLFSGPPAGNEFGISEGTAFDEDQSAVVCLSNGDFLVAFRKEGVGGAEINYVVRTIGHVEVDAGVINSTTIGAQSSPSVAAGNGYFTILWTHQDSGGRLEIYGRSQGNDGGYLGLDQRFAPPSAGDQDRSALVIMGNRTFAVWDDKAALGADSSGSHIGGNDPLLINAKVRAGDQTAPSIAPLLDGRFVVVWTDPGVDPGEADISGASIRARIFDPRTAAATVNGTALDDSVVGTKFGDTINGQAGDDWIDGAGGKDLLGGAAGADFILGRGADDRIFGHGGGDRLSGGAGDDRLDGGSGRDLLDGGDGGDRMTGGGGPDGFLFAAAPKSGADRVTDFLPGTDRIRLDQGVFKALEAGSLKAKAFYAAPGADAAADKSDVVVYDTESGRCYYDRDGAGGAPAALFAILDGSPDNLSHKDFVVVA